MTQNRFSRKHAIDITIGFAILLLSPCSLRHYSALSISITGARSTAPSSQMPASSWSTGRIRRGNRSGIVERRFDYIYPPAIRYGTAITAMVTDVSPARAYHIYTAGIYCLGIAGVYAFVRLVGNSRMWSASQRQLSQSSRLHSSFFRYFDTIPRCICRSD